MGLGATWASKRCPCPWNEVSLEAPSSPEHSVISQQRQEGSKWRPRGPGSAQGEGRAFICCVQRVQHWCQILGSSSRMKCVCACPNNHQQNPCPRRVSSTSERGEIYERMCYQKFILPRVAALYLLNCRDSFHWLELGLSQTLETQTPEQVQTPLES